MPKEYRFTTQKELRVAFWETFPGAERRPGRQNDQCTDTRVLFVNWIDSLARNGEISEEFSRTGDAMTLRKAHSNRNRKQWQALRAVLSARLKRWEGKQ